MFKYLFTLLLVSTLSVSCSSKKHETQLKTKNELTVENNDLQEMEVSPILGIFTERLYEGQREGLENHRLQLFGARFNDLDLFLLVPYLQDLENLEIFNFDIIDISFINSLPNLKYLRFSGNDEIRNISSISNHSSLEGLYIEDNNNFTDLSFLSEFQNIKRLYIVSTDIDRINYHYFNFSYIEQMQNLVILDVSMPLQNSDFTYLKNLNNLSWISICGFDFGDLSPLARLPNLNFLSIIPIGNGQLVGESGGLNIMPLAASNSLEAISTFFSSQGSFYSFMENEGKIFEERGISIYSQDFR